VTLNGIKLLPLPAGEIHSKKINMKTLLLNTLTAVILFLTPNVNFGQSVPNLGVASTFALFTAVGAFDNIGAATFVTGDVGTNVGAFNAFPPGTVVGAIHVADAVSAQAATDVNNAYMYLDGLTCGAAIGTTLGSGQILTPNIYCLGAASTLNGDLILNGQGDPNALFIFQIDGAFSTSTFSNVILIGSASLCNVWWQINGAFSLGDSSVFRGTIVANGAISLLEGSSLLGRGLSRAGAIDLHNNVVTIGMPPIASIITASGPTTFCVGDSVILSGNSGGIWSNGSATPSITVYTGGDYFVTNTNGCGSDTSNHIIVTVNSGTPPSITCPEDVTIECDESTLPPNTGAATATDNCNLSPVVPNFNDITVEGACPQEYTITRTWIATDVSGNSSSCTQIITINDNTPPVITCPSNLVMECTTGANYIAQINAWIGMASATDACDGTIVITTNYNGTSVPPLSCDLSTGLVLTFTATDSCGNSSTCMATAYIDDTANPMITCPANISVQCASQVPAVNIALVVTSDSCGGTAAVTHVSDVTVNQSCPNRYTLNRTYRATDLCGNSATCAQVITVFDNTVPTLTCPAPVTVQCASQVPAVNTASVVTSDNCGGSATVTHVSDVTVNQTCPNRYTLNRTYRATDLCGNSATCVQVITVFDNTLPSITCPANIAVSCASQVPAVNIALVVTSDNCGGTATVTHVGDVITNQTCVNRFTLTRTYRATDACGNSALCAQVITVFDNTPPVITFTNPLLAGVPNGGTVEVQCFGQNPDWDLPTFDESSVNATDNCGGNVPGNVTVTFSQVLQDAGNCIQDAGNCQDDGHVSLYRLTWTATDVCSNSSSAFVFLALIDTIPPVIQGIPGDIKVNCDEIPEPPTNIFATDECLCAFILFAETDPAPGCQDGQVIVRSWTARDVCGNVTIETQNITLVDEEGPKLQIMQPEIAGITDGTILEFTCNDGGIPEFFDLLNAGSVFSPISCGGSPIISFDRDIIISNNCDYFGYVEQRTFRWEGIDQCGNLSTLTIIARVIDNEAPVLIGVPDTTCIGDPLLNDVDATDNCEHPLIRYWDVNIPNPCGSGLAVRRTYEAYDDCGNMSRDTAILIPNGQSHLSMEFVNPVLAELEFGEVLTVDCAVHDQQFTSFGVNDVRVEDACMLGVTVTFTERLIATVDCSTSGIVAVLELQWTATDVCGNLIKLTVIALVVDESGPVFVNFVPEITIGCNDELPEIFATDNCGEVSITTRDSIINGDCAFEYDIQRLVTATDPCGNSTTKLQTIHVGSGSGPIIEGVEEEICDDLSIPEVTAYDPCAEEFVEVTMVEDTLEISCLEGFVIQRIWSAVDICGHVTEITQLIFVGDKTPPEIQIPSFSIIRKFMDVSYNLVFSSQTDLINKLNAMDENSVFVLDDCDQEIIPVFTVEITFADDCEEDGYFERIVYTWVATDVCGNSTSISFSVDIMDDIPPVFSEVPDDVTIICAPLPPAQVVQTDDPAQPVTIVYSESIEPGEGPGVFIVTRKWIATDACGNSSVAVQHITWIPDTFLECDIIVPELVEFNTHGVVISSDVTGGIGPFTYLWEMVGEECFIQGGQGTPEIIIYVGWSFVKIILTVTDAYGCVSMCMTTLLCPAQAGGESPCELNISGTIMTHEGESVNNVEITLSDDPLYTNVKSNLTNVEGQYVFENNVPGIDYYVRGYKNTAFMNGVSTLDLIYIHTHLLGIKPFDSPYQYVAADANRSNTISGLDIIELRKLILGKYSELPLNTSWRFGNADPAIVGAYPWGFKETIEIENMASDIHNADFIGVKIGDVNGDVQTGLNNGITPRNNESLQLLIEDKLGYAGQLIQVDITAGNFKDVVGFQFALKLNNVFIQNIISGKLHLTADNYVVTNGIFRMSWNNMEPLSVGNDEVLFSLVVIPEQDLQISKLMSIDHESIYAEAYVGKELEKIHLEIKEVNPKESLHGNYLFQNEPNPFSENTIIRFQLENAGQASIRFYDVAGKMLKEINGHFERGLNQVEISNHDLGIREGMLVCQLQSNDYSAIQKMVLIK